MKRQQLINLIQDAHRLILSHKWMIQNAPLQTYISALLFSPTHSLVRELFEVEEPNWLIRKPIMEADWNACHQTLEGHSGEVNSVAFSTDGNHLASGCNYGIIKIWDVTSGKCLQTLEGNSSSVMSVALSTDGNHLASASDDSIKIWDTTSGKCLQTLKAIVTWSGQWHSQPTGTISPRDLAIRPSRSGMLHEANASRHSRAITSGSGRLHSQPTETISLRDPTIGPSRSGILRQTNVSRHSRAIVTWSGQ